MGQRIKVLANRVGDVAVFDLDRSLTGQDGISFTSPPEEASPPALLARRIWESDGQTSSVHVMSNIVTVSRGSSWDDDSVDATAETIATLFNHYRLESDEERAERLRSDNYNATITRIRKHNDELWVIGVTPDEPMHDFEPGQYTTLALGFWEPRADDASEDFESDPEKWSKMARRSYSVSSSIVDETGSLVPSEPSDVEFYIVQVPPGVEETPALTPRLFRKDVGDRLFMSRKFTGRYTLQDVEPTDTVVLLSTGTGEAPHNSMSAELLRNGHEGPILSAVCVRYRSDLAYTEQQAAAQEKHPNYRYVTMTTREPENEGNKVYIQDFLLSGALEEALGTPLEPDNTHVFLCGNPSMIGLPNWGDDGSMEFPEPVGVCELLHDRGFQIDRPGERGNVHYEEFWRTKSLT